MNDTIQRINRKFELAMSTADAAGMAAVYTSNGNALPPNGKTVSDTHDIRDFWQGVIDMGIAGVELKTVELDELDSTAIEVGEFALKTADGATADSGKYIVIWKMEAGEWRWHHDIWNSSNPVN